ncbi:hypothetical protein WOLCODRAFT_70725 [Wolfiporia cocos MD-104 SS10]|uniref:PIN domain-containing protein n=1 Tax=Wolfiporia cocos (strain MD-104) TaxID=742152 RepID=A0A2H3JTE9_WOLCO|nr:hypothetical protein WOLCODRAFT_70725 [Wolfiporia cocos MD-104 SS10]
MYLVLDTNVVIDHLDVLKWFSKDVEALGLRIKIVVPHVLLSELDGLKGSKSLGWFARQASGWILDRMRESKTVKVQARKETLHTPLDPVRKNDVAIYDCAKFFQQTGYVVLVSRDNNLLLDGFSNDVPTVCPPRRGWSSRDLARGIAQELAHFGVPVFLDVSKFRGHDHTPVYRPSRGSRELRTTMPPKSEGDGDDRMDVDDDGFHNEYIPSHALDALHLQVIDHFTPMLKDLAARVRTSTGDSVEQELSRHAPWYRRKGFDTWTVGDCLEYLGSKKRLLVTSPSLRVFLLGRSEDRGWRRGQDWSHQDWQNAMTALQDVGTKFEDRSTLISLGYLKLETERVFKTPMRPTGI